MAGRLPAPLTFLRKHPVRALAALGIVCLLGAAGWGGVRHFRVEHHYRAAQQAAERRDFARALEHLAVCLRLAPDDGRVRFLAARTARRAGDFDRAREHLRACKRLGFEPKAVELEWALWGAQQEDFAAQEPSLGPLVEQGHPDAAVILEVLVDGYIRHYRMTRALRCLDLYLERQPENARAWFGRGQVCERLFYWEEAVRSYRRAVALQPGNEQARLGLAKALVIHGRPDEAAAEFESLRQRRPADAEVLLGLARCRRRQGRPEEAGRLLDELTSRHPDEAAALLERGRLALDAGNPAGAERWLRPAVARSPHDREARYCLFQCLKQQRKEDEARECFAAFARLDADLQRIDRLTRQMQKTPYDPELYHEAGVLCLRNGDDQEGLRWLRLALRYDPRHRPSHRALADYFQRVGKTDRALFHRQLATAAPSRSRSSGWEKDGGKN